MADLKLAAEVRTEFGKGAARQARRDNKIPAVIYGHGAEPLHVLLPAKATTLALRMANALLAVSVDGEEHLALAKDVQRNRLLQIIEHVDLLTVKKGEKVTVDVSIHIVGEVDPRAVMNLEETTVAVEASATDLPESLTVNVEGRKAGEHILASDIELPAGTSLLTDPDMLIVNIYAPSDQDLGAEPAEAPAAAPAE